MLSGPAFLLVEEGVGACRGGSGAGAMGGNGEAGLECQRLKQGKDDLRFNPTYFDCCIMRLLPKAWLL